ncbi:MAG: family 20 glycosylhydrolase [Bacteroidaceae bacterium]|nr:family 20 glycosylhydrolase [Bacteroidaceae bacterium]
MTHRLLLLLLALIPLLVPAQTPRDYRMGWRGLMLDSGRQYQDVEYIETLLDQMAERSMNVFHWHLTETDGWRMQIAVAPRLTEVGAFVANGKEQQGFYSREDMQHIVSYAAERGIMVVPEVDLPGHSGALIAAYPEFGCSHEVVCPASAGLMDFLCSVLDEVCEIFPSPYIHLGGDEVDHSVWRSCPACQQLMAEQSIDSEAALQVWFERQLVEYLAQKGRKVILWEDVLYETTEALPSNLVIQWWNYRSKGETGLREALRRGIPVICSSNYYCYLNFPTSPWRGYAQDRTFGTEDIELRNPSHLLFDTTSPLMLGMEACLWTDYNLTQDMLNERLFPRLDILARQMRGD